ncbi:MAG: hypothetical protein WDA41_00920 [Candidatus Neomarinimicrobiota bacterium]|nr:hypothetical protein [Candidatus Neomarinimicrobiota bacterium]
MMKRLVVFLLALFLIVGCQSVFTPDEGGTFSPPNWIQGTWSDESSLTEFTFTKDNIVSSPAGLINISFLELYADNVIVQNKSASEYEVSIENSEGEELENYKFEKSSNTTVDYYKRSSLLTIGPVVLIRETEE